MIRTLDLGSLMGPIAREVRDLAVREWGRDRAVEMVGCHASLDDTLRRAKKVAGFDEPVLIIGESGVGKELLAQALYLLDPKRRGKPFVSVNCPQYQEGNLTVSELFGHTKGSFTGATHDRKGCVETANGGVIFLDEIGDLHMNAQLMLLRALASGEFQPLGASRRKRVNVRVIAATNRPLEKLMAGRRFRNDLFFRLRYFQFQLPPLRERGDDWKLLTEYFLARLARRHGVQKRFTGKTLKLLEHYPWPGNVRELSSVVTMGYAMSEEGRIQPGDLSGLLGLDSCATGGPPEEDPVYLMSTRRQSFWEAVHRRFMSRDLNRTQCRAIIRHGLEEAGGSYRQLVARFNMPPEDYQRFMDFLRHHALKP